MDVLSDDVADPLDVSPDGLVVPWANAMGVANAMASRAISFFISISRVRLIPYQLHFCFLIYLF